ncbi:MAG: hypothetical protein BWK76_12250 [Desulfobulbaceae bacterium A2]|nr:MAG: hypothetical protein BWK76_12250 [Desulfobulbaceae bacterium A2]
MQTAWNREAAALLDSLHDLVRGALALESSFARELAKVDPECLASAKNLLHYLSLRQSDIRPLQDRLARLGLSSLGRLESHVMASLQAVTRALTRLSGKSWQESGWAGRVPVDGVSGPALLRSRADELLGVPEQRDVRIMVTMPSEAAGDYELVRNLLAAGMDVMRINCAHDGPEAWQGMIDNLRRAESALGKSCRIYADLAGPKLRTGALRPVGRLLALIPERDERGAVGEPAQVWLQAEGAGEGPVDGPEEVLPLVGGVLRKAAVGDELRVRDCRGVTRRLQLVAGGVEGWLAETVKRIYLESGAEADLYRNNKRIAKGEVGQLSETVLPLRLASGDSLVLTRSQTPGAPARTDGAGLVFEPATIPCSLEEAFTQIEPGERVCFDDGKICGMVLANDGDRITVRITTTGSGKRKKLAEGKGINFPDTDFTMSALTSKDLVDLDFVAQRVDMVGLSFVHGPEDVMALLERLGQHGVPHLGLVLKIENRQAFEQLPHILLAGLYTPHLGVMVARGDLAAEMGFDRLAEVQEEILWLCEAAHVPVIWATQVLESMAKKRLPSRAEITDAAMSGRAECVMLNKGPFIVDTVRFLGNILERMQTHQVKKRATLRRLAVSAATADHAATEDEGKEP